VLGEVDFPGRSKYAISTSTGATVTDGAHGRELFAVERATVEALCSER